MDIYHLDYQFPTVQLLQESGLGVAEIAGRTCYDSFTNSENVSIQNAMTKLDTDATNTIEGSELLDSLAWVHHHHSIIEHATLSFLVRGTSRGVLQEHARHRIQAISVRSTRYTMSSVINAFVASLEAYDSFSFFFKTMLSFDMFVVTTVEYLRIEIRAIYEKLMFQFTQSSRTEFIHLCIPPSSIPLRTTHNNDPETLFEALQSGKKKRNVGDAFKHIVTDNWKVDMVVTFNLRSLKNYFDLRDSGSAYFQIRWLAQAMKEATPKKYLRLIDKKVRDEG